MNYLKKLIKSILLLHVCLNEIFLNQKTIPYYNHSETEFISGMQKMIILSHSVLEWNSHIFSLKRKHTFSEMRNDTDTLIKLRIFWNSRKYYDYNSNFEYIISSLLLTHFVLSCHTFVTKSIKSFGGKTNSLITRFAIFCTVYHLHSDSVSPPNPHFTVFYLFFLM